MRCTPSSAGAGSNGLSLDVVIPQVVIGSKSYRHLQTGPPSYLVFRNVSDKPFAILVEGNSWGDEAVTYEAMGNGRKVRFSGLGTAYTKNYPEFVHLEPGECYVRPIKIRDDHWKELSRLGPTLALHATFSQTASLGAFLKVGRLWSGTASSTSIKTPL